MKKLAAIIIAIVAIAAYVIRVADNPAIGQKITFADDLGGFVMVEHGDAGVAYVLISERGVGEARVSSSQTFQWGIVSSALNIETGKQVLKVRMAKVPKVIQISGDGSIRFVSRTVELASIQELLTRLNEAKGFHTLEIAKAWLGQPGGVAEGAAPHRWP